MGGVDVADAVLAVKLLGAAQLEAHLPGGRIVSAGTPFAANLGEAVGRDGKTVEFLPAVVQGFGQAARFHVVLR